jgi:hypothetical protein
VFLRDNPGFDAIVGNPPYAGRYSIVDSNPRHYLDWLKTIHEGAHGNADIVAHFFRRAYRLLRQGGTFGLIATKTIRQGDTRATGLRWIRNNGGIIYAAKRRYKWPGEAAVIVSVVHIAKREFSGTCTLDGRPVGRITAYLADKGGDDDPIRLVANAAESFQGSVVVGMGFTFDDFDTKGVTTSLADMRELIDRDPRNADRIFPYIGGEEVNTSPTHAHHRFVINFGNMTEMEARRWPELMAIVEKRVRPEREASLAKSWSIDKERRAKHWWQFARPARELYAAIAGLERVLVTPQTSNVQAFAFLPATAVFAHTLIAFPFDNYSAFAVLQSRVHQLWSAFLGPTMKDDLRYTPSDCFETFPFPNNWENEPALDASGKAYYKFRAAMMVGNQKGLTATYKRFHDPSERDQGIIQLRESHAAMDRAVLEAYGWSDIDEKSVHEREWVDEDGDGPWRYRWPEPVRDEVLARLLALNAERAAEEARQGLTIENIGAGHQDAQDTEEFELEAEES